MGLSGSKQKTTTNQRTSESATRTPTNPQWVTDAVKGFTGKVTEFGNRDPQSLVAGPSDLQQKAFEQAGGLGNSWRTNMQNAGSLALGAAHAPANTYNPATASLGNYAPNREATGEGYTATQAEAERAAASRASQFLGDYLNPYLSEVVDTTAADMDESAGQVRAAQAAAAARNGAFGGSRYGIQEAQTEGELARARASTLAGLRSDAYEFAGQMGNADASRFTDVSKHNASLGTQTNIANAGFNNDALAFGANARNQADIFNAGQTNQRNANMFGAETANNQFNANAKNAAGQFNAGQQDAALGRRLQAAGLLGDLSNSAANNQRGDIALTATLGAQQRELEQQRRLAELMQLESMGGLLGSANFGLFNGQQVNSTGTLNGTQTTKSSPGLMGILGSGLMGASMLGWAPFGNGG